MEENGKERKVDKNVNKRRVEGKGRKGGKEKRELEQKERKEEERRREWQGMKIRKREEKSLLFLRKKTR